MKGKYKQIINTACFKLLIQMIVMSMGFFIGSQAFANPVLSNIDSGNVSIQQTPNSTVVNQTSPNAIINWESFNIGQQESTHFQQPEGSVILNRINPQQGQSAINGNLTATGQIILVNPAGIYFGPSAYVNVGGLIATTANITNQDFLNNYYHFSQVPNYSGAIINEGQIIAANHGLVALIGSNVQNNGLIQANLGHIVLATGKEFTMNFAGNELISFSVDEKSLEQTNIKNTGTLIANGGTILVTAKTAQNVLDNVINMQGVAQAQSVQEKNGEIIFSGEGGGTVYIAAKLDASGKKPGQKGGNIQISGQRILVDSPSQIDVSGDQGGGNLFIGGNAHGTGPLPNANATVLAPQAILMADAISSGDGGNIVLWANDVTRAYGTISARGGKENGKGGFVETSSHSFLDVNGLHVDVSAANGKMGLWLLDPSDLTIFSGATSNVNQNGNVFTADNNSTSSFLNVTTLLNALATADVTVQTTAGGTGLGAGDILINAPISWNSATTLTLLALNAIVLNDNITVNTGTTLSVNTVISGDAGNVILNGGTLDGFGTSVAFGGPILLVPNVDGTINANAGTTFTISGGISGTGNLIFQGQGSFNITEVISQPNTLTDNAASLTINTTNINTRNNQIYNGPVILGVNTTLLVDSSSGQASITFNSGISGNRNLTLTGDVGDASFILNGQLALNNVSFNFLNPSTTNSLTVNTGSTQNWIIDGTNAGRITGISGVSGSFTFNTMPILNGGSSNNNFILNGGTLTGSINGGSATNTLTADNVNNTWTINGTNAGTVTGISGGFANIQNLIGGNSNDSFVLNGGTISGSINGGSGINSLTGNNVNTAWSISGTNAGSMSNVAAFSNIQNLIGGNNGNTFIFADNANITGSINGQSLNQTNTIDLSAYSTPISVTLSDISSGTANNNLQGVITEFTNFNNIINNNLENTFILPNKTNSLVFTAAKTGFVGDPFFFNGFQIFNSTSGNDSITFNVSAILNSGNNSATINGQTMFFVNFPPGIFNNSINSSLVANVMQQIPNSQSQNYAIFLLPEATSNLNEFLHDHIDNNLSKLKINVNCIKY